jgi:hypothetical protein
VTDEPTLDAEVEPRAVTSHGWPYPVASDPVAGGAAAIQALATKLDTNIDTSGDIKGHAGASSQVRLGDSNGNAIVYFGLTGTDYFFRPSAGGALQTDSYFTIKAMHPVRTHSGWAPQIVDPVLGPSNNVNSYTIAFLAPFGDIPVVVTEKLADVMPTTISTTGVTINQTGGSGNQYRGIALGSVATGG